MQPKIVKEPDLILHQPCSTVSDFGEVKRIADDLLLTVRSVAKWWNRWLGFAANQIGYPKKIIVLRNGRDSYQIMVNPEFLAQKFPFPYLEKCYSVPGLYLVKRYLWSRVRYQDLEGNWHEAVIRGQSAIYQEMDHLEGFLVSEKGKLVLRTKDLVV